MFEKDSSHRKTSNRWLESFKTETRHLKFCTNIRNTGLLTLVLKNVNKNTSQKITINAERLHRNSSRQLECFIPNKHLISANEIVPRPYNILQLKMDYKSAKKHQT